MAGTPSSGTRALGMGTVVKMRELVGKQNPEGAGEHVGPPLREAGSHERGCTVV